MTVSQSAPGHRRRPRRGSLERPINGRLYRSAFLLVLVPLLILAFSVSRPAPLAKPTLPASFDDTAALTAARELASQYPDRTPGTPGAAGAAKWVAEQLQPYGLPTSSSSWTEHVPGLGRVRLTNLIAVAPGQSPQVIVVMAHRDDLGVGPGANDNASGTAALIELARTFAQPQTEAQAHVASAHTIVFLSTDGGSFGGLGAAHFVESSRYRKRIMAVINLDAIAGAGRPRLEIAGSRPRSPNATLVATAVARIGEQTGVPPRHVSLLGQLVDLAFPYTLYEQGPFVAAGIPAVTLTTAGNRPPPAFGDTPGSLQRGRLDQMGQTAEALLGSLNQGVALAPSPSSYLWLGGRVIRGWPVELVLIALLLPVLIVVVDLYALCQRHGVPFGPAVRALRSRLGYWLFAGVVFTCFRLLGAWPSGPPWPPNPATPAAGRWPVVTLLGMLVVLLLGWALARRRLAVRRRVTPEEQLAGYVTALLGMLVVALLVAATNPFALLFVLPALHLWLWLPQVRTARAPLRLGLFLLGLVGPAILVASLAWRFGLGLDAPWYLLELVAIGYASTLGFALVLAGTAAAAQLAAAATGRYAPYPGPGEHGPRGPIRKFVRVMLIGGRAGRREVELRRRAVGTYRAR